MNKVFYCSLIVILLVVRAAPVLAQDPLPYAEPSDCPIDVPQDRDIECGVLVTPENYAKPDGPVVRLPYIIIHSTSPNPDPTPVVFTEGGPGLSSLPQVWGFATSVLVDERDMIIFEQRGSRYAEPSLMCEYDEIAGPDFETTPCLDRILAQGIDISQYTTAVLARDIESLRTALGIEQWNLYGASYSTRLMQWLMTHYPEGIRSVILQAANPLYETRYQHDPEHSMRVLQIMFDDCAADPACAAAYPDLENLLYATVADLNEAPVELELTNAEDGSTFQYLVDGKRLIDWMVGSAFYGPVIPHYDVAYLPMLIEAAARRDPDVLQNWAERQLSNDVFLTDDFSIGLYFAVNCQDDTASITEAQMQAQIADYPQLDGFSRHLEEYQVCELWDLPAAPPLASSPVNSKIPTLVLVGRYDPITPPTWAQEIAANLSNSFYIEFPSKGHSLDNVTDCAMQIKRSFLRDPWSEPDTSCLADEPPVGYVLPGEVIVMPSYVQSWDDINFGVPEGNPVYEAVTGTALVICILSVVLALVSGLVVLFSRRERRKEKRERFNLYALLWAALVGGLSFAVVVLMSLLSQANAPIQKVTMVFGFLADYPYLQPLGIVVYLQILCALVLAVLAVRGWLKPQGALFSRVALTLTALAAFSFWPFYLRWDLTNILWQMLFG